MKIYEIHFTFTPPDPTSSGEGLVTISADNQEDAEKKFLEFLDGVEEVVIQEVREIAESPGITEDLTPRTLQ